MFFGALFSGDSTFFSYKLVRLIFYLFNMVIFIIDSSSTILCSFSFLFLCPLHSSAAVVSDFWFILIPLSYTGGVCLCALSYWSVSFAGFSLHYPVWYVGCLDLGVKWKGNKP